MSLWDFVQHAQIRGIQRSQGLADTEHLMRSRRQDERADTLEDRITKLTDLVEALWAVMEERLGVTDDDLAEAVSGVVERRERAAQRVRCTGCGAAVLRADTRCQYCGTPRVDDEAPAGPPVTF